MVGVRVSLKLEASWDFFSPEANRLNSFLRILQMQFHRKKKDKNKQKRHKTLFESLSKNTWQHMEVKYLDHDREAIRRWLADRCLRLVYPTSRI